MPSTTKDGTALANRELLSITNPVERNVLSTLTCTDLSNAQQPNDAYVEIGIMLGGTTPQHKIAALASGYIGRDCPVSWSGKIITESEMFLYAHVYSSTGGSFRLAGLVTPYLVGDKGELLLDP